MNPWDQRVFVIAEAGVNHNGDLNLALQLVDAAAEAGCDAVKFQTFNAASLASKSAPMAAYQKRNTQRSESQVDMLARLELSHADHVVVKERSAEKGIMFFSTAFDSASLDFLISIDIPVWKIPSGEITNKPYLKRIAGLCKSVILSTGMATLAEVSDAVDVLLTHGLDRSRLSVLHCTTDYPTQYSHVNLHAMVSLGTALGTTIGYSDHTLGCEIPVAAVALGARVVEKHFTLDRGLDGPDHKASLEPYELKQMVAQIRHVEDALGDGIKRPTAPELASRDVARKSIVAARSIRRGDVLTEDLLTVKRPGMGISPMQWDLVLGRTAVRDYDADEAIEW